jgi:hypothetical protein
MSETTYDRLIALLDANKASYRLIDHEPEGQTDKVSAMRGHPVEAAAKCIVLIVKIGKKSSRFVLAVVPGAVQRNLCGLRRHGRRRATCRQRRRDRAADARPTKTRRAARNRGAVFVWPSRMSGRAGERTSLDNAAKSRRPGAGACLPFFRR